MAAPKFNFRRGPSGGDGPSDFAPPRQSILQVFFHVVRIVAVMDSLLMTLCQCIVFARDDSAWLQGVLRVYVILFCFLFISSELQLEDKIGCIPAARNWMSRGFLYSFIAVIGYEESTTLQLTNKGEISANTIVTVLKQASWVMFALGVLYAIMGCFCVKKLRDRIQRNYDQERGDRERLRQHYQDRNDNTNNV